MRGKIILGIMILSLFCVWAIPVMAENAVESDVLLGNIDLEDTEKAIDDLLDGKKVSIQDILQKLINGEEGISLKAFGEAIIEVLRESFQSEKQGFLKLLLLILIAAIFSNFSNVFENGQVGEISFYIVYMLLFVILADTFRELTLLLQEKIELVIEFMKALTPAYYLAILGASGSMQAMMFYQFILILIVLFEQVILVLVLPAVNIYVLLGFVNHLTKEEFLSKLTELLKTVIDWGLKSIVAVLVGLEAVRGLVAPAIDSWKRTLLGKTASAIPGVGNIMNSVTEVVLGSAVLIRGCLGAAILLILLFSAAGPLLSYIFRSFLYRLLAAVTQPISDKRMTECLSTMGEGCAMLFRTFLTIEILFMLTIAIASAGAT